MPAPRRPGAIENVRLRTAGYCRRKGEWLLSRPRGSFARFEDIVTIDNRLHLSRRYGRSSG